MKIPPSTEEKYPTFIVMTANMLDPCQLLVVNKIHQVTHSKYPTPPIKVT